MSIVAGALALAVLWQRARRRSARDRATRAPLPDADCEVSECGADGVPLSSYAG